MATSGQNRFSYSHITNWTLQIFVNRVHKVLIITTGYLTVAFRHHSRLIKALAPFSNCWRSFFFSIDHARPRDAKKSSDITSSCMPLLFWGILIENDNNHKKQMALKWTRIAGRTFNWAVKGRFFLRGRGGCTHPGYKSSGRCFLCFLRKKRERKRKLRAGANYRNWKW